MRKNKLFSKIIAWVLMLVIIISTVPISVSAKGSESILMTDTANVNPQSYMPYILSGTSNGGTNISDGTVDNMQVTYTGQRLTLKQTGGSMKTINNAINPTVGYYLFPQTDEDYTLTADVVLNTCGATSENGIFFGAFDGIYLATVGIRNKTNLRGIYSKSLTELTGPGGIDASIEPGERVSFTVHKETNGLYVRCVTESGLAGAARFDYGRSSYLLLETNGINTPLSYGFALANATATITNMKMLDESGNVLYDQNKIYNPYGTAPVAASIRAELDSSKQFITVNWEGDDCENDGKYVLQVSRNGVDYTDVSDRLTGMTYQYDITEGGNYYFRVCGTLGNNSLLSDRNSYVTIAAPVKAVLQLDRPVPQISATESAVTITWDAVPDASRYEVYRYSDDESAAAATKIADVTDCTYTDTNVTAEMPYYYYVSAHSQDSWSKPSDVIWTLTTNGHSGEYVYEDDAANILITKKSYDTVYTSTVVLEGSVDKAGKLSVEVNGVSQGNAVILAKNNTFAYSLTAAEGRNDVTLYFTDEIGRITRKTFNFVYLTHYDKVVDRAYTGTDGAAVDGIPVYKSVQAAVDSVPSNNAQRVVILIKSGSYEEYLKINTPYISLVGEDREMTRIHCYPGNYDVNGACGRDMAKRCAVYIQSAAVNFTAENLTFANDYMYLGDGTIANESADALRNDADNTCYVNVKFDGWQNTLCTNSGKQYYTKCLIMGMIDFIYGNEPRAYFNDCDLVVRYSTSMNSRCICAPKTAVSATYGLTFNNCRILSPEGSSQGSCHLARPWGADAYVTWINCYMGKAINAAEPYKAMSGNLASNARFFECGSYGPGFAVNQTRRQLPIAKANEMQTEACLGWAPATTVEAISADCYIGSIVTTGAAKYDTTVITPYSGVYDGKAHGLSVSGKDRCTVTYCDTEDGTYTNTSPTFTNAGTYTVYFKIIWDDGNYYRGSSTVTISKAAAPGITWPKAASITYGAALSTSMLSGGSTEYGSFAWTNGAAIPAVGNNGYSVTFTPSDTTNYDWSKVTRTNTVKLTVKPKQFTITYKVNGGKNVSGMPASAKYDSGKTVALKGTPVSKSKFFAGWNTKANGRGKSYPAGKTLKITGNITLYAQWKDIYTDSSKLQYKVTGKKEVACMGTTNKKAASITIGKSFVYNGITYKITSIAKNAFRGNKKIKTVKLGNNIKTIENTAFYKCPNLTKVTIGTGLTTIGSQSFGYAKDGLVITVNSTKLKSVKTAINRGTKNMVIKVPKSKLSAYKKLFAKSSKTIVVKAK